jgi:hypothetical protein
MGKALVVVGLIIANFSFYFPLTTSIILSVLLTLLFSLFRR